MSYRKTWFSYVLWALYTVSCIFFLVFVGNCIWTGGLKAGMWKSGPAFSASGRTVQLAGFLMLPVTAAVYWRIRVVSGRMRKKYLGREKLLWILEGIAACGFLALGIYLRVMRASEYIALTGAAENGVWAGMNGIEYFNMAAVTADGQVRPLAYGAAYLYVAALSFVLTFLGNKAASAIVFQVILQIAGLMLAYVVTRKSAGRLPACMVLLCLACSAGSLEMLKNLGPECFYFVLYMVGMLVAVEYGKRYCAGRLGKAALFAGAVVTGALIGSLGCLDITAFTILAVITAIATGKKKDRQDGRVNHSPLLGGAAIVVILLSCAGGFAGTLALLAQNRGMDLAGGMAEWAALHLGNTRTFAFRPLYPYSLDLPVFGIFTVLAAFLTVEFFRGGREQNYTMWILLCLAAAPTPLAVIGLQPFGMVSLYLWGVLGGLGLQNCILGGRTRLMQSVIEEINQAAEEAERAEEANRTEEAPAEKERAEETPAEMSQTERMPAEEAQTEAEPAETAKREEGRAADSPETGEQLPSKPRYLENPLPLPRKPAHRRMDYQYQVEEKDMKFDVEIKEDDDFDL